MTTVPVPVGSAVGAGAGRGPGSAVTNSKSSTSVSPAVTTTERVTRRKPGAATTTTCLPGGMSMMPSSGSGHSLPSIVNRAPDGNAAGSRTAPPVVGVTDGPSVGVSVVSAAAAGGATTGLSGGATGAAGGVPVLIGEGMTGCGAGVRSLQRRRIKTVPPTPPPPSNHAPLVVGLVDRCRSIVVSCRGDEGIGWATSVQPRGTGAVSAG